MERKEAQRKGLREVAELAGVSMATASRVANGSTRVAKDIQKRVLDAALKLGVDLNRRNKTKALAFLLSNRDMLHPFHSHILVGTEAACAARGWDVLFLSYSYPAKASWRELHLPQVVQRRDMVRAVILAGTNSVNLLDLLQHRGIPYVVLGNNVLTDGKERQFDAVCSDDIQGAYEMTRYLQQLHHRDTWFVGNMAEPWSNRYFQGYERAMKEAGLPSHVSSLDSEDARQVGYLGTKSLLNRNEPVTAILGATDETAEGIYKALKDCGLRVPQDISVAGCNDTYGSLLNPPLTTIREFPEQLGKQMVELVLKRVEQPDLEMQHVTIPIELVKRESCQELRQSAASKREPNQVAITI